ISSNKNRSPGSSVVKSADCTRSIRIEPIATRLSSCSFGYPLDSCPMVYQYHPGESLKRPSPRFTGLGIGSPPIVSLFCSLTPSPYPSATEKRQSNYPASPGVAAPDLRLGGVFELYQDCAPVRLVCSPAVPVGPHFPSCHRPVLVEIPNSPLGTVRHVRVIGRLSLAKEDTLERRSWVLSEPN